eukprot:gene11806-13029_t
MTFVALITVAIMVIIFIFILNYLGVFQKIKIEVKRPPFAACTFLYKFYKGRYSSAGTAFHELDKVKGNKRFSCVGIYFDDPDQVAADETCYAVGVFIEKEKTSQSEAEEITETMRGVGYKSVELPAVSKAVCTTFPFKIGLSIVIAVAKVYPALRKYVQENKISPHPYLEYYKDSKIYFTAPLEECEKFYVPEYELVKKEDEQMKKED